VTGLSQIRFVTRFLDSHRCVIVKKSDLNIMATLQLADAMLQLANKGDAEREDAGCGVLYGVLLDSAFKIKKLAEAEKAAHIQKGWFK